MSELMDNITLVGIRIELEKIILEENGVYERIIQLAYIDLNKGGKNT